MTKLEFDQIYIHLEYEIKRLSQLTSLENRDATREDAHQAIIDLKPSIDGWVNQLNDREISCYELESLMESKINIIQLHRLKNRGMSEEEINDIKYDILRLIARSIMNAFMDQLFKNRVLDFDNNHGYIKF